ncbi:hypothetical protein RHGRI_028995 [Rhododendron griersonianum]|uniref:Uncharacterized protein n=1 Tax=Rhododendron griersonianum TaxID=479676 RepID=A0AAV6IJW8_9ERIC|nr:hypothetical protein RHGRI_028995 [Rhododendron griersonianum]
MATAVARHALRRATGGGGSRTLGSKRNFASSAHHDDAYEAEKWEKITYAGIFTCTVLAIYNLSKPHRHYEEPPPYPYLRSRQKDIPPAPRYGLFT